LPVEKKDCENVFHLYVVYHPKRNFIIKKLKKYNIQLNINYPIPIHKMKTYIFNRTIYTRVRKANGKVGKNTYPSYFHESGRRFVRVNNKIHDTPWKFNDGVMGVESIKDGKWVYSLWYKKGDSVVGCSSKKEEPCGKYDQSESRDGDSEGYLN